MHAIFESDASNGSGRTIAGLDDLVFLPWDENKTVGSELDGGMAASKKSSMEFFCGDLAFEISFFLEGIVIIDYA